MKEGQRRNRKKKNKGEMWAIGLATTFFLDGHRRKNEARNVLVRLSFGYRRLCYLTSREFPLAQELLLIPSKGSPRFPRCTSSGP